MQVGLAYGRGRLDVPLRGPDPLVVRPDDRRTSTTRPGRSRGRCARRSAARRCGELVRDGDRVVISVCDGTRAQPRDVVLPVMLDEIAAAAPRAEVTVLVATGTHRANTPAELEAMLGRAVLDRVPVVNHDARDAATLVDLGVTATASRSCSTACGWRPTCG